MNDAFSGTFRIFLLLAAGALAMIAAPQMLEAIADADVPAMWWIARSFGLLAYLALWLSTLFGVLVAGRGAGGLLHQPTVLELHSRWAVAALVTTALHVLASVGDPEYGIAPLAVIVPLAADKLTGPVALGTLAVWGMATVALTTAIFRRLPRWLWRAVHASAFGTYALALVHGIAAGTDTGSPLLQGIYAGTGAVLLGAVLQRMALAWEKSRARARRSEA